jgi:hypothetical protein
MTESNYTKLASINVNDKIEKKNNLSYLSWAWAVDQLLRADPLAHWTYGEPVRWNDTVMVFCTVTAFGKPMTAQLPVMDYKNKAISNPDAFAVNTAMQRCLAKAIALHGLGLYIYAGEDVPETDHDSTKITGADVCEKAFKGLQPEVQDSLRSMMPRIVVQASHKNIEGVQVIFQEAYDNFPEEDPNELKKGLWHLLDSKTRSAISAVEKK